MRIMHSLGYWLIMNILRIGVWCHYMLIINHNVLFRFFIMFKYFLNFFYLDKISHAISRIINAYICVL